MPTAATGHQQGSIFNDFFQPFQNLVATVSESCRVDDVKTDVQYRLAGGRVMGNDIVLSG